MPRSRNIKPSLFKNELLGVADPYVTLLFSGLWMLADREGRLEDRPLKIKGEIFPHREGLDVNVYLTELYTLGFIRRYVVGDVAIIHILNFNKHQHPHRSERPSVLPEYVEISGTNSNTGIVPLDTGAIPEAVGLIPDSLNLIPDVPDTGIESSAPILAAADYLKILINGFGYDERQTRLKASNMTQALQWLDDGVTRSEFVGAVRISVDRFKAKGEQHDPPVAYLAKVIASNREKGTALTAGVNTQSGFTAERYVLDDEIAKKYNVAGAGA